MGLIDTIKRAAEKAIGAITPKKYAKGGLTEPAFAEREIEPELGEAVIPLESIKKALEDDAEARRATAAVEIMASCGTAADQLEQAMKAAAVEIMASCGTAADQLEQAMKAAAEAMEPIAEVFEKVGTQIAEAVKPAIQEITKQISMIGMDKWDRMLLEESNNHRKLHKKPMIRRRQLRKVKKRKKKG